MATIKLGTTGSANRLITYVEKRAVEKEGIDCSPEYAKTQFATTRKLYGKTKDIQAHSVIQSFKPGEITPDQANKIGLDLAKKLAKGHECVVYTHADTKHIHNHIVINSVNYENGKKLHLHGQKAIDKVRNLSDELCKERGLSVVKEPNSKVRYTLAEQGILERGETSWKDELRQAIDYEKSNSKNYEEFKNNLTEKYGIEVNDKKKHITYKHPDHEKVVRGNKLGLDYERGTIENVFSRQVEREPSEERRNSDLSDRKRPEFEGDRKFTERNERTQPIDEELYKSSYGRGNSQKGNIGRTVGETDEYINTNSREDDFDIERARNHSSKLRKDLNKSYGKWKDSNEQEQSRGINSNESNRENTKDFNRGNGKDSAKELKRSRTKDFDLSR